MRLANKAIVVTGASRGIGRAIARGFVSEGASVVCSSRTRDVLEESVSEIADGQPGEAIAVPANVRSWESVQDLIATALQEFDTIDVLVNNAAVNQRGITGGEQYPIADVPVDVWDAIVETNLRGAFLCTKAALPTMLESDVGRLIHVSSRSGERAKAAHGPYAISKFGLEALHECLGHELEDTGVDSLVLRPPQGGTDSGMMKGFYSEEERAKMYDPDIMSETATKLATGEGRNGGRYIPIPPDGMEYYEWPRKVERPSDHPDLAEYGMW